MLDFNSRKFLHDALCSFLLSLKPTLFRSIAYIGNVMTIEDLGTVLAWDWMTADEHSHFMTFLLNWNLNNSSLKKSRNLASRKENVYASPLNLKGCKLKCYLYHQFRSLQFCHLPLHGYHFKWLLCFSSEGEAQVDLSATLKVCFV